MSLKNEVRLDYIVRSLPYKNAFGIRRRNILDADRSYSTCVQRKLRGSGWSEPLPIAVQVLPRAAYQAKQKANQAKAGFLCGNLTKVPCLNPV